MDFSKIKKIYLVGVKGVGLTMLGQYLAAQGVEVSGSDGPEKYMTDEVLEKAGIKVIEKFDVKNLPADADLIIYSTAYSAATNVEVAAALAGKIKTLTYAQALGEVFNQKYGIAVVGSHGKTTTTAWLGYLMEMSGLAPNVMVGARVPQFDGCSLIGNSDYLVIEADEYQNKLENYQPKAVLLNNIDYDHPDFFPTEEDYKNAFIEFIKKISSKGFLVANFDDPIIRKIAQVNCKGKVITYAINEAADYVAYDIKNNNGRQYFKVKLGVEDEDENETRSYRFAGASLQDDRTDELGDFSITLGGRHNILNALAVIAAGVELNIELFKIRKYLEEFTGTARRMQVLGEFRGAAIIDDYAHHPTEIKATIEAVRQKYGNRKLIVAFHPHTFSRTKALFNDFAGSFAGVDELTIIDIYGSARERHGGVHSRDLVEKIKSNNQASGVKQEVKYISTLAECEKYLRGHAERDDVIVLMGAGDIFRVGENLVKE
ncbi:MAG: UDP-N-acetylmuramate--L-alanine ligase [Parcubacteria group bacterium CG1_02_44_65]|nr:MAG: UDP-N-acetylmuramate--L-alanine ligase [Parcubacteria group bacterium CG1_02_44_65]